MVSKTLPWPYKWAEAHGHSPSGVLKMAGKYCYQRKTDYWLKNVHLADRHFVKHILWKSGEFWKTTEKGHNIQQHWATSLSQHVDTTAIWESPHPTTEKERKYDRKRCTVMNCSAGKHTRTLCFVFAFYLNANWQKKWLPCNRIKYWSNSLTIYKNTNCFQNRFQKIIDCRLCFCLALHELRHCAHINGLPVRCKFPKYLGKANDDFNCNAWQHVSFWLMDPGL